MRKKRSNVMLAAAFGLLAAVTGWLMLAGLQAAAASLSLEAEQGTLSGSASIITDSNASGGRAVAFGSAATPTPTSGNLTVADQIISDTFGKHDDVPRGVPDGYSWKYDADTDPNTSYTGFKKYGAINLWGQIFVVQSGNTNYNVRIQVRDPRIYYFNGSTWAKASMSPDPMNGAYWAGDFSPSASSDATTRSDGGGMYSTSLKKLSGNPPDVFHFWWDGMYPRIPIPSNAQGILVRMDYRLIPDDGYTGIAGARYIATACADLFATPNTTIGPGGMNPGIPEGRMKYVTGDWQHFYDTTLSEAQIKAFPPPITD